MKKLFALTLLTLLVAGAAAEAQKPTQVLGPGVGSGRTLYLQQWNRTLSADTTYVLTGLYSVDSTYTLTIPAGTVVQADTAGTLIVRRGARIYAEGTVNKPIIFTSLKPAGQHVPGDWAGVLILGRAPVNKIEPLIEGGIIAGTYGGTDPEDDSGVFKYCRIEWAGYRFQLNNETNGLTMGGVGRGTEIHHVQVSYANDDSYEWFGGTVDCSYLVAIGGIDDELDTDFGYTGKVQFALGVKDLNYWDPTGETNGFESDNDGSSTSTALPYTEAIFSNITLVGPQRTDALVGALPAGHRFQYSVVQRRSSRIKTYNSVIVGYPWGLSIRDPNTIAAANNDIVQWRNVSLAASNLPSGSTTVHDEGRWAGVTAWFNTPAYANFGSAPRNPSSVGLTDMSDLLNPNPVPLVGSELDGSANFDNPYLAGFAVVAYRGAFAPGVPMNEQWTAGWTNFDPQGYDPVLTAVETSPLPLPGARLLAQNHPNPFNPATTIRFDVPRGGHVTLKVYNVRGQEVATLVDGALAAGSFETAFAPRDLPSGTYLYRLAGPGFSETRTMQLVK